MKSSSKKFIFTSNEKHFYDDYSYRCKHWGKDDYTRIRFVENDIEFSHRDNDNWQSFSWTDVEPEEIAHIKEQYRLHEIKVMEEAFCVGT